MTDVEPRDAFFDAKVAREQNIVLARLDYLRGSDQQFDSAVQRALGGLGISTSFPLLNQWAFLSIGYAAFVYLAEAYGGWNRGEIKNFPGVRELAGDLLRRDGDETAIEAGCDAADNLRNDPVNIFRRIRNSMSHGRFEITSDRRFFFADSHPGKQEDWIKLAMPWELMGYCADSLILICSHELFGRPATNQVR